MEDLDTLKLEIAQLREKVKQLEAQKVLPKREKIQTMSSEVVDSNPYRFEF